MRQQQVRVPSLLCFLLSIASPALGGEVGFVGDTECLTCHDDVVSEFEHTPHAHVLNETNARTPLMARGCESCHGPGEAHVEAEGEGGGLVTFSNESVESREAGKAACLSCHERGARVHWKGSPHDSRELSCSSCHTIMRKVSSRNLLAAPSEPELCGSCHLVRRAQTFRNAHMPLREGAMECTSCHNAHGSTNQALLAHDTVNDTCFSCHAEKRGPFLWEHAPVTESCLNCHDPHGSTRAMMLKVNPPRLCQQCHIPTRHPSEARRPDNKFVSGRACVQCHADIHGSNHPSGVVFSR